MDENHFSVADVIGSEKLTSVFGSWPSFHDAEVFRIELLSTSIGDNVGPTLVVEILVGEWTHETDSQGRHVTKNQVEATLRFERIEYYKQDGFDYQNALDELIITDRRKELWSMGYENVWFEVRFVGDNPISFRCQQIEVTNVVPSSRDPIARFAL